MIRFDEVTKGQLQAHVRAKIERIWEDRTRDVAVRDQEEASLLRLETDLAGLPDDPVGKLREHLIAKERQIERVGYPLIGVGAAGGLGLFSVMATTSPNLVSVALVVGSALVCLGGLFGAMYCFDEGAGKVKTLRHKVIELAEEIPSAPSQSMSCSPAGERFSLQELPAPLVSSNV